MMSDLEVDSVRASSELALVRRLALAALEALERERQRIDGLNIYPVPDGDTGMNLVLTVVRWSRSWTRASQSSRRFFAGILPVPC